MSAHFKTEITTDVRRNFCQKTLTLTDSSMSIQILEDFLLGFCQVRIFLKQFSRDQEEAKSACTYVYSFEKKYFRASNL